MFKAFKIRSPIYVRWMLREADEIFEMLRLLRERLEVRLLFLKHVLALATIDFLLTSYDSLFFGEQLLAASSTTPA